MVSSADGAAASAGTLPGIANIDQRRGDALRHLAAGHSSPELRQRAGDDDDITLSSTRSAAPKPLASAR